MPRPITHDLLRNVLDELGAEARRVVVTELRDHTFYAEIELVVGKATHRVSSRPSDAIALAVRTGTPIFAEEQVLDEAGQTAAEVADDAEERVRGARRRVPGVHRARQPRRLRLTWCRCSGQRQALKRSLTLISPSA